MSQLNSVYSGSPQERFHLRCNQFQDWDSLSVTKLLEAFYLLMTYYVNESSSAKAGQGAFAIHPDLKSLFCELLPENLPYNSVPPPSEIVQYLSVRAERAREGEREREARADYSPSLHYLVDTHPLTYLAGISSSPLHCLTSPSWLSNGDILAEDSDRSGHVPSPAPGDPSVAPAVSPQRKLSVIPEVPGFSRPPSLAELAVAKHQKTSSSCEPPPPPSVSASTTRNSYFPPPPLPRSLHQHSIESSVVTEGHYDASFETEDPAASFDVEPPNYQSYEAYTEEPTILSNGHYKMSSQELNMLGMNQAATTTTNTASSLETSKQAKVSLSTAAVVSDPMVVVGAPGGTKIQDGRKGETEIKKTYNLQF